MDRKEHDGKKVALSKLQAAAALHERFRFLAVQYCKRMDTCSQDKEIYGDCRRKHYNVRGFFCFFLFRCLQAVSEGR